VGFIAGNDKVSTGISIERKRSKPRLYNTSNIQQHGFHFRPWWRLNLLLGEYPQTNLGVRVRGIYIIGPNSTWTEPARGCLTTMTKVKTKRQTNFI